MREIMIDYKLTEKRALLNGKENVRNKGRIQVFQFYWLIHNLKQKRKKAFDGNHAKVMVLTVVEFCLVLSNIFFRK